MRATILAMLLVVSACSGQAGSSQPSGGSVTTTAPTTPTTAGTRIPVGAVYEPAECSATPPVTFAVLCDTFADLMELHVDDPDPAALAAAAALGVAGVAGGEGDVLTGFSCVTPHESFQVMCDAIVQRALLGPVELESLVTGAVQGMFRYGLDPFSSYVSGAEMEAGFDPTGLVLELGMVVSARTDTGAACSPITEGCSFEVLSVFEFGAAASGGVATGDHIVSVDGVVVDGLSSAEATALLAGRAGTSVTVRLDRDGDALERTLVREDVRLVPTEVEFLEGGIAYLRMNDFSQQAAVDLGFFLQLPEVEAASGMILDLRDNPGGLVLAAQAVASQFLDGGLVMVERGKDFIEELPVVEGGLATSGLDLAVLVNRASASAAEIVAAVLQERGRALVVGENTFGKNLVQVYETTRDGGQVGITVARWETPEGLDIGITGLAPDVAVAADPASEADEVLDAAITLLGG